MQHAHIHEQHQERWRPHCVWAPTLGNSPFPLFEHLATSITHPYPKQDRRAGAAAPTKVRKKPAAAGGQGIKPKNALQLRPKGCSKCRRQPGCSPSCWKQRHGRTPFSFQFVRPCS